MSDSNMSNSERSGESFDEEESDNNLSSSSGSTDSSDDADDGEGAQQNTLELAKIADEVLKLPRGLCENSAIFKEFFSMATWQLLSENFKTYLMNKHFPAFAKAHNEDKAEKETTVNMLFNNQIIRFGQSPMLELQRNLEEGNYRPDVLKLRQSIAKSRKREQRFQSCERISQMARQLFISRERLLRTTYKSSPADQINSISKAPKRFNTLNLDTSISAVRARKRFSSEIKSILQSCDLSDISEDESSVAGDLMDESLRESRVNSSMEENNAFRNNPTNSERCIYNTLFKRKHETADEDAARAQYDAKHPKLNNRNFRQYLLEHKRRKLIEPNLPEYETVDIRLRDVYTRAQVGGNFKRIFASGKTPGRKPKSKLKAMMPFVTPQLPTNGGGGGNSEKGTDAKLYSNFEAKHFKAESDISTGYHPMNAVNETLESIKELQQKTQSIPHLLVEKKTEYSESSQEKQQQAKEALNSPPKSMDVGVKPLTKINAMLTEPTLNQVMQHQSVQIASNTRNEIPKDLWMEDDVQTTHLPIIKSNIESNEQLSRESPGGFIAQNTLVTNTNLNSASRYLVDGAENEETKQNHTIAESYVEDSKAIEDNMANDGQSTTLAKQMLHSTSGPELLQETHACFFSLLREFFCSTPNHRMNFDDLREKVNVWLCNPITALNDWYLLADSWSSLLTSAINFLAGDFAEQPEEYVPFIEFKPQQNIYQWIGAGRDSDARLMELSSYWLSCRNKITDKSYEQKLETNAHLNSARRSSTENEDFRDTSERGISPPPPPRYPTTWTVVAATPEEVIEFQQQERERFENPHRAYTYRMHGYESVVGPVKGIYTQILALTKARGHSMMIGDRPNFVTILTLVRDATARLPNGEGTRADISELLKCSQYINRDAAENVLQTIVSGALDRMHTEHDPCVRYDPKRKIWIYLHRNRSEEDFERMHQQYQGLGKHKKPTNRKTKPKILKDAIDGDFSGNNVFSTTAGGEMQTQTSNAGNSMFSLPALVPANPIIVNTAFNQPIKQQQQQQQQQQQLAKCPPVPPLKYNIQPLQQQQKSLLKTTLTPNRSLETKPVDTTHIKASTPQSSSSDFAATFLTPLQSNATNNATVTTTQTTTMPHSSLITFPNNKSLSFAVATNNAPKVTNILSGNNTTPIIVATPTGLKTVHVSNATSNAQHTQPSSPAIQLVKTEAARQTVHTSALSATVGGKKVALNKPIIINQITQQTQQVKTQQKSLQSQLTTKPIQKCQQQQQQQQNFVIPRMHLNSSASEQQQPKLVYEKDVQTKTNDTPSSIQAVYMESAPKIGGNQEAGQINQTPPHTHNKNIIRILSGTTATNKSIVTVPLATGAVKQPAHIIGQRIVSANATQALPKSMPGITMISNNSSNTQQQLPAGTIRMSSQAFAQLQQKQQTQQNVLVKATPTMQQHRVVMGRSTINAASLPHASNKNIIVQPCTLVTTPKSAPHQQTTQSQSITSKGGVTSVINITPQATTNAKIQSINTTNLTGPQQKILLQNLKQQSLQFKTVQVVPQQQQQQQQPQHQQQQIQRLNSGGQNVNKTVVASPLTAFIKNTEQQTKSVTISVSQPQMLTKTNSQLVTKEVKTVANMNNATGQIISLEGLLAKQGGTLRVSNATTMVKVSQANNIIQLASNISSQDATQYGNAGNATQATRNLITVGTAQQIQSSQQTGTNAAVFTAPLAMSVGQIKDTTTKYITTGTKIIASQGNAHAANIKSSQMVNANVFGKVSSNTSATGASGFKIISTGGVPTNFNIANIQGKQVILASKPAGQLATTVAAANQGQKLQNSAIILSGQAAKLQGNPNVKLISKTSAVTSQANTPHLQTVIMGNQLLRLDQLPTSIKQQIQTSRITVSNANTLPLTTIANTTNTGNTTNVISSSNEATILQQATTGGNMPKTFILGTPGQKIRFQGPTSQPQAVGTLLNKTITTTPANKNIALKQQPSRVVLAVQGGGQIFLSPNYQSGSVNLKSLQNVKVVSMAQTQSLPAHHDQQHQERIQKASPQKQLTQQSILRATSGGGGGVEKI